MADHRDGIPDLVRSLTVADRQRFEPPADLWERISVAVATPDAPTVPAQPTGPSPQSSPFEQTETGEAPSVGASQPWKWLLIAAVSIAVVGLAIGRVTTSGVVATADLVAGDLPDGLGGVSAVASVISGDTLELHFAEGALPEADGFYEVWLIRPDLSGMYSLGTVVEDGRFAIPSGVDPNEFSIVDISREPLDGQPVHSGISVLRGQLDV